MFSMVTVPSSTRMPTASAKPPSVITLIVCPSSDSAATENRMARGIEIMMMIVERHEPRNTRIIRPVSVAAMTPSRSTPSTASLTKADWSPTATRSMSLGRPARISGSSFFTPSITSSVEAEPAFWMVISTAFLPSTLTMLVCGGEPACTKATSRT